MILFDRVSYTYPGAEEPALRNVSLHLPEGEMVLVMGPSGAGKSTILRLVLGLLLPDSGEVLVEGTGVALLGVGAMVRVALQMVDRPVRDDVIAVPRVMGLTALVVAVVPLLPK